MNSNFPTTDPAKQPANPTQSDKVKELWSTPTLTKLSVVENTLNYPGPGNDGSPPVISAS